MPRGGRLGTRQWVAVGEPAAGRGRRHRGADHPDPARRGVGRRGPGRQLRLPWPATGRQGEDWYVRIDDGTLGDQWLVNGTHVEGTDRRQLEVTVGKPAGISAEVVPGDRLMTLDGKRALLWRDGGRDVALRVDVAPGVQAFSGVRGDLAAVETMLASLTNLDRDDPRLDQLAMRRGTKR